MDDLSLDEYAVDDPIIVQEDRSIYDAFVGLDYSFRSDIFLEDSFSIIPGVPSTPTTPIPLAVSTSRKPNAPVKGNASSINRLSCDQCRNTYANQRTLNIHKRMHAMKRASLRLPNLDQIKEEGVSLGGDCLKEMLKECLTDEDSQQLSSLCICLLSAICSEEWKSFTEFLCEQFCDMLKSRNVLLPSALRCAVYCQSSKLFSKMSVRNHLKALLKTIVDFAPELLWFFIGIFCLKFLDKLLVYVLFQSLHGQGEEVSSPELRDDMSSYDFIQTLYHIVGSVLHACLVRGRMYKNSSDWAAYCSVLKSKCIRQPELGNWKLENTVISFSSAKNRGGYVHCNQETFNLFFQLFELLLTLEKTDDSLSTELVDQEVSKKDVLLFVWDDLVGSKLTEEQSMFLLLMITHISLKIVARGIIKRRLNKNLKTAYSSVALRASLAKRK